jgi:putative ABC transport system ATP-binding protein
LSPSAEPALAELRGVTKAYRRGAAEVVALRDVSLEVARGEFLSIMGPSGSGKSTLLALLGCLDVPSAGEYRLEGKPVHELSDEEVSRVRNETIGFVFQSFHLIPQLTVVENVETPLLYGGVPQPEWRERAQTALARVGLTHRAEHRPGELSGGEAQRAAIARALVVEPSLLLADEPTGNLDSVTGEEVAGLLAALHREGRSVVLVTHNEALARRGQRMVRLRDGRIDVAERL